MKQRKMRLLREKHGVSIAELSRHCGVSPQRLSQIELESKANTTHLKSLVKKAFSGCIKSRQKKLSALASDFQKCKDKLLDFAENKEE